MTSKDNATKTTVLLSFKFLKGSQVGDDFSSARDLLKDPKHEEADGAPFSFAFSGTHDGGVMPLPKPQSDETARLAAHDYYGHLVEVLKEGKSAVDSRITGLVIDSLPVAKKAQIEGLDEEEEEQAEEEAEVD